MRLGAHAEMRSVKWYAGSARDDRPLHGAFLAITAGNRSEKVEFTALAKHDLAWMADHYDETLLIGH